jgi:hypothetical protein
LTAPPRACALLAAAAAFFATAAGAQAPLVTDDAGVTPPAAWHLELFEQHAELPRADAPARSQDTTVLSFAWGCGHHFEIGFDAPWIVIHSAPTVRGIGDLDVSAKFSLHELNDSNKTGLGVSLAYEMPTGNASNGLGSGLADGVVNLIGERRLGAATVLRGNFGVQFFGNTLTGAVGSRVRGQVASSGWSITQDLSEKLQAVFEVTGYQGRQGDASDRELRLQGGLVRTLSPHVALAAAVQRGWYATPTWTAQLGIVLDK